MCSRSSRRQAAAVSQGRNPSITRHNCGSYGRVTEALNLGEIEMNWKHRAAPHAPQVPKPPDRVYREHVQILREIRAPEKLIELAERVADRTSATPKK